jgi:hypothetical protein
MNTATPSQPQLNLVHGDEGLRALFPEGSQPSVRSIRRLREKRLIPFIKLGNMVFYDAAAVREALTKLTVKPRGNAA